MAKELTAQELLTSVFNTTKKDVISKTLSKMKGKKLTPDQQKKFSATWRKNIEQK